MKMVKAIVGMADPRRAHSAMWSARHAVKEHISGTLCNNDRMSGSEASRQPVTKNRASRPKCGGQLP